MRVFPEELGAFIASERSKYYKDRKDFANKIGLDPSTVESIEKGETSKPLLPSITAIARGLKISPLKLIAIYEGDDPDKVQDPVHALEMMADDAVAMLRHLPPQVQAEAMKKIDPRIMKEAIIQQDGPEKWNSIVEEAKRRKNEKKHRE